MILGALFLAGAVAASTPPAPAASREIFRLELAGKQILWSQDRPAQSGGLILFHRYPDGALVSIRRADLVRIVATRYEPPSPRALKPGTVIDLGVTGPGGGAGNAARGAPPAAGRQPALGERPDGTALFNPDRPYKPDWDSKLVPGLNLPNPASPNDYVEGKTLAYPPAAATQAEPGDLPRAQTETAEPPKQPE